MTDPMFYIILGTVACAAFAAGIGLGLWAARQPDDHVDHEWRQAHEKQASW